MSAGRDDSNHAGAALYGTTLSHTEVGLPTTDEAPFACLSEWPTAARDQVIWSRRGFRRDEGFRVRYPQPPYPSSVRLVWTSRPVP